MSFLVVVGFAAVFVAMVVFIVSTIDNKECNGEGALFASCLFTVAIGLLTCNSPSVQNFIIQYGLFYLAGVLLWFVAKWYLVLWQTGKELSAMDKKDWENHIMIKTIYKNGDPQFKMRQPEFIYLASHAVLFFISIPIFLCNSLLYNFYLLLLKSMQKIADSFIPKV